MHDYFFKRICDTNHAQGVLLKAIMLNVIDTVIIGIDIQEKLVRMLANADEIANNSEKILQAANILNIDTILTEQYPKGLGETIDSIKSIKKFEVIEKTSFSACLTQEFIKSLNNKNKKKVVIFGIETHICVLQTVLDLIKHGFDVYVVQNCCASRNSLNHNCALDVMKQFGAKILTLEIVLFEFLKTSKHPNFKEIQLLIK